MIAMAIVEANAEIIAVLLHLLELRLADRIEHGEIERIGRRRVIHRGDGQIRTADLKPALAQHGEGLRRGDLVSQVQVDIQQIRRTGFLGHYVAIPNFLEQSYVDSS